MKKYTMIFAALLLLTMPTKAERVTPETARKVAMTFLNNNGTKTAQLTDLSKAAGFPNLYIFTAEQGFVVMAADDCVQPILGYSLTNKFVAEGMPDNVRGWLQGYDDEIQWGIDHQVRATSETAKQWKDLAAGKTNAAKATAIVDALVQTKWNQGSPYNNLCPKIGTTTTVTGCVATAMAQVMKFWEHPVTGTDSHSYTWNNQSLSADFGATTYEWSLMTNTYGSSSTNDEKAAVATLMHHCGVSVEMDYGISSAGGSAASTYDVMSALQTYFSYAPNMQYKSKDDYEDEVWITMLKNELNDGRPMQYRGSDAGGEGGHSFVCDGYDSDDKFHFNWGWGGYCDGFYALDDMEPGTGGIGAGNGIYTVGESAIFGIEPISSLAAPTLSATTAEGCINLTWNAISEAVSYDVYRDNVKIATNVTENSYTDNNVVSGTYYEYYVRAVNGTTRSNPSNFVTKFYLYRNLTPSNLTVTKSGSDASLTWTGYEGNLSTELHYAIDPSGYAYGCTENGGIYTPSYWAQRYPANLLTNFIGMEITKISACFYFASDYDFYVYNGGLTDADKLYEQSFTKSNNSIEWIDFTFSSPLSIDCSKDLWIVFYNNDANILYPAVCGDYTNEDVIEAKYLSTSLENLPNNVADDDISWLFRTYLTDGTYTYNLYQDGVKIAENLSNTTYNATLNNNAANLFTVTTNYYGGESAASNKVGHAMGSASVATLELVGNDKITVTKNSILTVSGDLSNDNPDNLILEDSAQLIHNTSGVKATVQKNIEPYSGENDGWYFIASPVKEAITPSVDNGLLSGTYDLYYYDEPTHYWKNHKQTAFTIAPKNGYLYANNATTTLQFAGTLTPSNSGVGISGLSHSASTLNGFNLVGNPFACNAIINQDCYVIDGRQVVLASGTKTFAPCEGAFVKADSDSYTVTFSKPAAKANSNSTNLDLVVSQDSKVLDRARVRIGESANLEKFSLEGDNGSQLSFWQEGQEYAVVRLDGQNELPLNFKAVKDDTYTLGIETNSLNLDYLHLIDNLTGVDVDLLDTPTYTFTAKTTDYASRFRLVFSSDEGVGAPDDAPLAFVSNGEIVITADARGASLQVIDATGRVIRVCTDGVHTVSTTGMTAGVYVLRLITADGVKTQKIVIE